MSQTRIPSAATGHSRSVASRGGLEAQQPPRVVPRDRRALPARQPASRDRRNRPARVVRRHAASEQDPPASKSFADFLEAVCTLDIGGLEVEIRKLIPEMIHHPGGVSTLPKQDHGQAGVRLAQIEYFVPGRHVGPVAPFQIQNQRNRGLRQRRQ